MRIKSYFAASVQAAIAMARKEFGEGVTLVTSHVSGPDARHLGQYEVVFAIEEQLENPAELPESTPESQPPVFNEFQQALLEAVQVEAAPAAGLHEKLDQLRALLISLGLEPATTSAVMTLIEKSLPVSLAPAVSAAEKSASPTEEVAPVPASEAPSLPDSSASNVSAPHLSAAELSFISAVSEAPGSAWVTNK
jgi:hypothetical protein